MKHKVGSFAELMAAMDELASDNDRTAAITGGALVEMALQGAIIDRLPQLSNTLEDNLFTGFGPLATFSAKILLGRAMGLYGSNTKTNLERIKRIRNDFSHDMKPVSFQSPHIKSVALQIKIRPEDEAYMKTLQDDQRPRERFLKGIIICFFGLIQLGFPEKKRNLPVTLD